jgi:TonB-dependent starch-binding outer membrane protein SusC
MDMNLTRQILTRIAQPAITSLLLVLAVIPALAQKTRTITGIVSHVKTNDPIPGASVFHKGTTFGTISDQNGKFSIEVADTTTLVISSIGFTREEVRVGDRESISVTLTEDIVGLDEIVVVGYGEQKRSNISGAVASVDVTAMENRGNLRIDQALQGAVSGVTVTRNGGAPGASPTIHIRGVGSIGNSEPLWIVDGIRMSPGNHFDLDDVESIEVLKDASSSAIYGASGAHGVIVVTTKRGKGNLQINLKSSIGKRTPLKMPDLLGSADFVKYKKQSRENAGQNPEPSWDSWEHDTDWLDAFYAGSGVIQSYDLSIQKGDEKLNYFFSVGHDKEEGILVDNNYGRTSLRFNSDARLTSWLKLGESILLSRVKENPIGNNNENYSGAIPYRSIPIMPIHDPQNPFGGWGRASVYFQGPNPVATQYQQHETRAYNRVDGNIYLEANPLKGLTFRTSLGYNQLSYLDEKFDEAFNYGAFANPINALTYSSASDRTVLGNAVGTYSKSFSKHNLKLMLGTEAIMWDTRHFNVGRTNFPVDVAWSFNLGTGPYTSTDAYNVDHNRLLSQFGRLNYNYDERYLFEANFRHDASAAKFGPANRWGFFPSFSAAWRISEESFFANIPYITNLKIRASYGGLGSDNIRSFIYEDTYTSQFSTYAFDVSGQNKVTGFYVSRFANKAVKWEQVNLKNVAIDLGAFNNKLTLSVDYYIKETADLLYGTPVPPSIGIATHNFDSQNPELNIGTVRNKGMDIEVGYANKVKLFSFDVKGNVSFMANEMISLAEGGSIIGGNGGGLMGGMTRTEEGHPLSSFYGYVVYRMFNSDGEVDNMNTYADDGYYQEAGTSGGDFMYKDLSGPQGVPDGEITAEYDRTFIGNPWPKMTYGFNVSVAFKDMVDLSILFQGVQGVDVFNANKAYSRNFFGDNNTTTEIYDAWTPENHTRHPRNIASDPNGNFSRPSTYFIEDGSYLKLRNVQLGFRVPSSLLQRVKLSSLRVYVNANNLLTLTKYSGLDPEIAGSNTGRGVDYGMYPQVRTYSAGLELKF